MRIIKIAFPIVWMMFGSINTYAQKTISEGTLIYTVSIRTAGDSTSAKTLGTAIATEYLKGGLSRIDLSSALGTEASVHDSKSGTAFILKEYSGQKLMITLTKDNWTERNKKFEGIIFNYDTSSAKKVDGYNCKKATAQLADGTIIKVYYTTDVSVLNKEYDNMFTNLSGVPVQYDIVYDKLRYTYSLSKIDFSPVPSAKFDIPKTGYRIMTYEESEQNKR